LRTLKSKENNYNDLQNSLENQDCWPHFSDDDTLEEEAEKKIKMLEEKLKVKDRRIKQLEREIRNISQMTSAGLESALVDILNIT
jgi:hypothetical protein